MEEIEGFISLERFESLTRAGKILSLSFWRDVADWRRLDNHRRAQAKGRLGLFAEDRLRAASVLGDDDMSVRDAAATDSRSTNG